MLSNSLCVRILNQAASQLIIALFHITGALDITSVPPTRTMSALPLRMLFIPLSIACIPEAQFLCTVHAGILFSQPILIATWRAIFASLASGMTQPIITSSISCAEKGIFNNNDRAAATHRSPALKRPGLPVDFNCGVRCPSIT